MAELEMGISSIAPPVTPFSSIHEIQAWIKDLKSRWQTDDVNQALNEAQIMLQVRKKSKEQETP